MIIVLIVIASSGITFATDEPETKELDPYKDLGFKEFKDFQCDFNDIPGGNADWHRLRTDIMPHFNTDLNALKVCMDYNAALADKLYANGTLNYTSGNNGRFQHVPTAVNKDMYYYDCKYDGYSSVILAYLDQFNGLMTPLTIVLGAAVAFVVAIAGIITLCQAASLAVAQIDSGQSLFVQEP